MGMYSVLSRIINGSNEVSFGRELIEIPPITKNVRRIVDYNGSFPACNCSGMPIGDNLELYYLPINTNKQISNNKIKGLLNE